MPASARRVSIPKIVFFVCLASIIWIGFIALVSYEHVNIGLAFDAFIFIVSLAVGLLSLSAVAAEKRQRQQLQKLTHELQVLDDRKTEFINMAAHELRAPLTAVKGFLSMVLAGDAGEINDKTREFIMDSAVSTQRMIRLVNNMLNVSRIEDGRMMYSMDNFSLSTAAKQVFDDFQIEASQKKLSFRLEVPNKIHDAVFADRDRVQEVIVNLLSNAIKYTVNGSVILSLSNPSPHVIRLEVKDTGPGISDIEQKKLFQKFYRIEAKVGKTIGTGLGLYICQLLIKHFNGTIGVTSQENIGSTFWFELPVKPQAL